MAMLREGQMDDLTGIPGRIGIPAGLPGQIFLIIQHTGRSILPGNLTIS